MQSKPPASTPPPAPLPAPPAAPPPQPDVPDAPPPSGWKPPVSWQSTVVGIIVALAGMMLVLAAWGLPPFTSAIQSTENAYVRGQVAFLSPQISGYVQAVPVQDYERVRAGQIVVVIDDRIYQQKLAQARAMLAQQEAGLANSLQSARTAQARLASAEAAAASVRAQCARAEADMARVNELLAAGSLSLREGDIARATLLVAQASVRQADAAIDIAHQEIRAIEVAHAGLEAAVAGARAALQLAEIDVANTRIVAPQDGQLGEVTARPGQYVTAGTQLASLVPMQLWVVANFKEAQTARMAPGQRVRFSVDALAGQEFTGSVERISPATGSEFSVFRPDNATGNFTKVAQRLPVRIAIDAGQPDAGRLRPGMSVVAHVDTSATP